MNNESIEQAAETRYQHRAFEERIIAEAAFTDGAEYILQQGYKSPQEMEALVRDYKEVKVLKLIPVGEFSEKSIGNALGVNHSNIYNALIGIKCNDGYMPATINSRPLHQLTELFGLKEQELTFLLKKA